MNIAFMKHMLEDTFKLEGIWNLESQCQKRDGKRTICTLIY